MADASDSKSDVGDYVWVQVPSPAFLFRAVNSRFFQENRGFTAFCCCDFASCICLKQHKFVSLFVQNLSGIVLGKKSIF